MLFSNKFCWLLLAVATLGCAPKPPAENPDFWKKIKFNLSQFDANGFLGTPSGKVAGNYEFCIPPNPEAWYQAKKIDPTLEKQGGAGRSNCQKGEVLVIGSTAQPNFRRVLYQLASLEFVREINQAFWE